MYILTVLLGAYGALGLLRGLEVLFTSGGLRQAAVSLAIGALSLGLALMCLRKARAN